MFNLMEIESYCEWNLIKILNSEILRINKKNKDDHVSNSSAPVWNKSQNTCSNIEWQIKEEFHE